MFLCPFRSIGSRQSTKPFISDNQLMKLKKKRKNYYLLITSKALNIARLILLKQLTNIITYNLSVPTYYFKESFWEPKIYLLKQSMKKL